MSPGKFKDFYNKETVVFRAKSEKDLIAFLIQIGKSDAKAVLTIVEGKSRRYDVGHYSVRIDSPHGDTGQIHMHWSGRKIDSGSVNKDGSSHDGYKGTIVNKIADFARSKGFTIRDGNIVEGLLENLEEWWYVKVDFLPSEFE